MAEATDMARITVRVPIEARDRLYQWAEDLGVRTGHFASMALMIGAEEVMYRHRIMQGVTCAICGRPVKYGAKVYVPPDGDLLTFCELHDNTQQAYDVIALAEHDAEDEFQVEPLR